MSTALIVSSPFSFRGRVRFTAQQLEHCPVCPVIRRINTDLFDRLQDLPRKKRRIEGGMLIVLLNGTEHPRLRHSYGVGTLSAFIEGVSDQLHAYVQDQPKTIEAELCAHYDDTRAHVR